MRLIATFAAAALCAAAVVPVHADAIQSIVVYGDSLSDNGNLYALTGGFAPAAPYVNGEFSNGPVAVEQLAALLHVPLQDFAFGGATTGIGNVGDGGTATSLGFVGLPGIATELAGSLRNPSVVASLPSSLTVVWGGADDFETLTSPTVAQSQAAAATAAENIDAIVSTLQLAGAKNILVPNLPDLGLTPEFYGDAAASAFTSSFNSTLAASLPAGATPFDTDAVFTAIVTNPGGYGFSNVTTPCASAGANPGCAGYLFFDAIHPTTAADTLLAQDFQAAVTPAATPEPSSLVLLGTGLVGAVGMLRRRKGAALQG